MFDFIDGFSVLENITTLGNETWKYFRLRWKFYRTKKFYNKFMHFSCLKINLKDEWVPSVSKSFCFVSLQNINHLTKLEKCRVVLWRGMGEKWRIIDKCHKIFFCGIVINLLPRRIMMTKENLIVLCGSTRNDVIF